MQLYSSIKPLYFLSLGLSYDLFDRNCVTEHNKLRRLHGAQPLIWSEAIAEDAQKWAEYLAINDKIEHDSETLAERDEGENIAWFVPPQAKCQGRWKPDCVTCGEVVQNWYDEVQNYDYQKGTAKESDLPINHFAQVTSPLRSLKNGTVYFASADLVLENFF